MTTRSTTGASSSRCCAPPRRAPVGARRIRTESRRPPSASARPARRARPAPRRPARATSGRRCAPARRSGCSTSVRRRASREGHPLFAACLPTADGSSWRCCERLPRADDAARRLRRGRAGWRPGRRRGCASSATATCAVLAAGWTAGAPTAGSCSRRQRAEQSVRRARRRAAATRRRSTPRSSAAARRRRGGRPARRPPPRRVPDDEHPDAASAPGRRPGHAVRGGAAPGDGWSSSTAPAARGASSAPSR